MLTDGMPADRDELQKLLNAAYRKGNQDAHAARDILVKLVPSITAQEIMDHYRKTCPAQYGADDDLQAVEWCHKDCRWAYGLAISRINGSTEAPHRDLYDVLACLPVEEIL